MCNDCMPPEPPQPPAKGAFLRFIGPIVLGMNDALVEMTGALAGFTMTLGNNKLIALAGLTTGVAATLSMATAEFMAKKAARSKSPWAAAASTGVAYLITVALLLLPYFFQETPFQALTICLFTAALIIFVFTFVTSNARNCPFWPEFLRMLCVSLGVAAIAFFIS